MSFTVRIANVDELKRFLPRFAVDVEDIAMDAAKDMVFEADRLAKDHARDKSRKPNLVTGRYFSSIHPVVSINNKVMTGKIASNVHYAGYLEKGTPPHAIYPKNKKALRFNKGGQFIFAKKVNHPGTPAFRVLGGAADEVVERTQEFVDKAFKRKFEK